MPVFIGHLHDLCRMPQASGCPDKKKTCPIQLLLGQVRIYITCGATRLGMITYPLCAY